MEFKKIMTVAAMIGAISFGATTASAQQGALTAAIGQYGTVPQGCVACHSDGNGQKNTVTAAWLAFGGTKSTGPTNWAGFDAADSDNDGIANGAEFMAGTTAYTTVSTTPSTGGDSGGGGCVTSSVTTPLTMVLAMLTLGFFVRRKKD